MVSLEHLPEISVEGLRDSEYLPVSEVAEMTVVNCAATKPVYAVGTRGEYVLLSQQASGERKDEVARRDISAWHVSWIEKYGPIATR